MKRSALCVFICLISLVAVVLAGCFGGSATPVITFPGGNAAAIDNGQAINITANIKNDTGMKGVNWSLTGPGTLSNVTTTSVTYNAPAVGAIAGFKKSGSIIANKVEMATVTATAAGVTTNPPTSSVNITVTQPPTLSDQPLMTGTVGTAYSQTLNFTAGAGTQTFAVTAGSLPNGLSLNATTGVISSGTNGPTGPTGTSVFSVKLTDASQGTSGSQSATGQVTISVMNPPAPVVPAIAAQSTTEFLAYGQSITQSTAGALGPFTWTVTGLPPGLTTNNSTTGTIMLQGSATGPAGMSTVSVSVKDSGNPQQTSNTVMFPLTVNLPPAPVVPAIGAQSTTEFLAYGQSITQTTASAHGPFTWTVTGLPTGLTTDNSTTGTITIQGAATGPAGPSTVSVSVKDSASPQQTSNTVMFTLTVNLPPAPTLSPTSLPSGTVGTPYNQMLTVSGGHAPFTFSVSIGSLPNGLALSPLTPTNGTTATISGTPTMPQNNVTFTIQVLDSSNPPQTGAQAYTVTINKPAPPAITTTQAQVPSAATGVAYNFTFQATGTGTLTFTPTPALADGLTMDTTGHVTGTPTTAPATVSFNLTVSDTFGQSSAAVPFTITVSSIGISFTQQTGSLSTNATFTFIAAVTNDPQTGGVDWSVSCGSAGACGGFGTPPAANAHTASGMGILYTAPAAIPTGTTVTITAASHTQPSVSAPAMVTITMPTVTVVFTTGQAPPASLATTFNAAMSAAVTGDASNGGVDWSVSCGSAGACGGFGTPPAATITVASGVVVLYTAPAAIPTGTTVTIKAASHTLPAQNVTAPVTITTACPGAGANNDREFCGDYAFFFYGYQGPAMTGSLFTMIGRLRANGNGTIDVSSPAVADTNGPDGHQNVAITTGTYTIGMDNRGTLNWTIGGVSRTYAIVFDSGNNAKFIEFDSATPLIQGSGVMIHQNLTAVSSFLPGDFAFELQGALTVPIQSRIGILGRAHAAADGTLSGGEEDTSISGTTLNGAVTGTFTQDAFIAATGKLTAAVTVGTTATNNVVYMIDANRAFQMSTGVPSAGALVAGTIERQVGAGAFGAASLSGGLAFNLSGQDSGTTGTNTIVGRVTASGAAGANNLTAGEFDGIEADVPLNPHVDVAFTGTYTVVDTNGRGTISLVVTADNSTKPFTFYLISPNRAFLMEGTTTTGGNDVEVGLVEVQTGPFSNTVMGNGAGFAFGSITPAVNSNHNDSGILRSMGSPNCTLTFDETKGDGTLVPGVGQACTFAVSGSGRMTITITGANGGTTAAYFVNVNRVLVLIPGGNNQMDATVGVGDRAPTIIILP